MFKVGVASGRSIHQLISLSPQSCSIAHQRTEELLKHISGTAKTQFHNKRHTKRGMIREELSNQNGDDTAKIFSPIHYAPCFK